MYKLGTLATGLNCPTKGAKIRPRVALLGCAAALLASTAFIPTAAHAAQPNCTALASQILATYNDITSATSVVQPAAGANPAFCFVKIVVSDLSGPAYGYEQGQQQAITVGIGLPLSTADGGSGGVQGNWNGRIQDLGGGGYAGGTVSANSVSSAPAIGYVGSFTDTGHTSTSGNFIFNADGTFSPGIVNDFIYNGIHAQAVWSKKLTQMYYGMAQKYAYWNGCSTGGRQGHQQAQRYPNDYDGILAGSPAINWDRFQMGELWGQVVMNQELGAALSTAKANAVTNAAIAACQNNFGGTPDGIIQEPRACHYNATAYICGASTANVATLNANGGYTTGAPDTTNCLTQGEAAAVDKIWQGPTGVGANLWAGLERGASFFLIDGPSGPSLTSFWGNWIFQNPNWAWQTLNEDNFTQAFDLGETVGHIYGTDDANLSRFAARGAKMITFHGLADYLIVSGGTYDYYDRVAAANGGFANTQQFYRFFPFPGNGHCGGNSNFGINTQNAPVVNTTDLFNALVSWVEQGQAPDTITGYNNSNYAAATVTRPICMHPNTLVYNGTGSIYSASSFSCQTQTTDANALTVLPDTGRQATYGIANTHDFNADGKSDIVWRDTSGNIGMWLMNGASVAQSTTLGTVPQNWSVVGQRDFAGNSASSPYGDASVLWRDTTGDAAVWQMNGITVQTTNLLTPVPTNWFVAATGDFNADGMGDILWEDNQGKLTIWFMNGTQMKSAAPVGQLQTGWSVVGADKGGWIFFRNTVTGDVAVWVMNGAQVAQSIDFGSIPMQWSIAGIGDFDGNGFSDILWRDNAGNVGIWLLQSSWQGPMIASSLVWGNVPLTWSIAETGDYNGDGKSDILWVDNTGNVSVWFMNGTTVSSTALYGNVGKTWNVQSLNAD